MRGRFWNHTCSILSTLPLFAFDALAQRLGADRTKRAFLAGAQGIAMFSVSIFWGHPEDAVAMGLMAYAFLFALDGRWSGAAWLYGFAVAFQPLVLAVFPVLLAMAGVKRWFAFHLAGSCARAGFGSRTVDRKLPFHLDGSRATAELSHRSCQSRDSLDSPCTQTAHRGVRRVGRSRPDRLAGIGLWRGVVGDSLAGSARSARVGSVARPGPPVLYRVGDDLVLRLAGARLGHGGSVPGTMVAFRCRRGSRHLRDRVGTMASLVGRVVAREHAGARCRPCPRWPIAGRRFVPLRGDEFGTTEKEHKSGVSQQDHHGQKKEDGVDTPHDVQALRSVTTQDTTGSWLPISQFGSTPRVSALLRRRRCPPRA